ncbi:hypothetical protein [uncultured Methanospirillum sp.]|uniref:hypothetical protein n=1 Tax=uncultured Methanospirillum sp. TaxID=262503 RepID=UPI0029C6CA9B|nr:hypothetical protein [uncultured Methanospirillum sp.]
MNLKKISILIKTVNIYEIISIRKITGDDEGTSVLPDAGDEALSFIQSEGVQSDTPEDSDQCKNQQHSGVYLSSINPHDFVRMIEGPNRRRCSVCGKR